MSPAPVTTPTDPGRPEPVFEQRFERRRHVLLAPAGVGVAIAAWVAAVQLGGMPPATEPPAASDAVAASARPSAAASSTARPTRAPLVQIFRLPLETQVLIRDDALRQLTLATGLPGQAIGATGYVDRVLALPDGRFVCICARQRTVGEERRVDVTAELLDPEGEPIAEVPVGSWTGADQSGLYDDVGPFLLDAAHDGSGELLAVTVSVRRPPEWHREAVVVDLADMRATGAIVLPPAPSAEPGLGPPLPSGATPRPTQARSAWPAAPRFSPDRRHLLLSALELDAAGRPGTHRDWVVDLDDGAPAQPSARELERTTGIGGDPCRDAFPEFGAPDLVTTLCIGDSVTGPFVRRIGADGTGQRKIPLGGALKDAAWPYQLVDGRGTMWLWDAWTRRAVRVDLVAGEVTAAERVGGSGIQARLVDPAMLLTPDGARLVVAAADERSGGLMGTRALVLDAVTLELVRELDVGDDMMSIGLSRDGSQLYVAHGPPVDAEGRPQGEARLSVFDLEAGDLLAMLGRMGSTGFTLVDAAMPGS